MISNHIANTELDKIFEKMFLMIGQKYCRKTIRKENWFQVHTWTQAQENEYIEWLIKHLKGSRRAREELTNTVEVTNKKFLKKCAMHFVGNYGWKLKEVSK